MFLPSDLTQNLQSLPPVFDQALQSVFGVRGSPQALKTLGASLQKLWPQLAKGRGQQVEKNKHYSFDKTAAQAYGAYYLPANFLKIPLVLAEMKYWGLEIPRTCRWLDLGCGPGTAVFGAWWFLNVCGDADASFWGFDQSPEFLALAHKIAQALALRENFQWQNKSQKKFLEQIEIIDPRVVSAVNSLSEFGENLEERRKWLAQLTEWLSARAQTTGEVRWLIFIEPGSQAASRDLLALREGFCGRTDARIFLPCLSDRACGALVNAKDWCHEEAVFEAPVWHQELGRLAGLRKEQLLFSYLVVAVGPGVHDIQKMQWPLQGARIVSQRLEEKGLHKCHVCLASGEKKLLRVLDSKVTPANEAFYNACRGQVFHDLTYDEKGNVVSFLG